MSGSTVRAEGPPDTVSGPMKLAPEAPWDRWCVAPVCPGGLDITAAAVAAIAPTLAFVDETGAIEARVRARVLEEVRSLSSAVGGWDTAPMRDVVRAVLAAVAHDGKGLRESAGIGAALLRTTLTLAAERALPPAAGCYDAARVNAVYEGLAMSIGLSSLPFPERSGTADTSCVPIARAAQRWVDGALARTVLPADAVAAIGRAKGAFEAVRGACWNAPEVGGLGDDAKATLQRMADATSIRTPHDLEGTAADLRRSAAALRARAADLGAECAAAIDAAVEVDAAGLVKADAAGFASADAASLVEGLGAAADLGCTTPDMCAARDLVATTLLHLHRGLRRDDYVAALHFLADRIGLGDRLGRAEAVRGIRDAIVRASEAAIVVEDGRATIDEQEVVQAIFEEYAPSPLPRGVLVDVSGGVPGLASGQTKFVGDGTVGYQTTRFGVAVRGGIAYYDFETPGSTQENDHAYGALESFVQTGDDRSAARFEGRFSGGLDYIDTTSIQNPGVVSQFTFSDYDSLLVRGLLEVGFVVRTSERFRLDARAGGGIQYEWFDSTALDSNRLQFVSPTSIAGRATGHFGLRWRIWPQFLALRAVTSAEVVPVTTQVERFETSQTPRYSLSSETQIYLEAKGFIDLDVAKFFGFVPGIWGGVSVLRTGEASAVVPVAGIAIFRPQ